MKIWYRVPSRRRTTRRQARYCAMDDYTPALRALGGDWSEMEIGTEFAVLVTVPGAAREDPLIAQLDAAFSRIPEDRLESVLATPRQRVRWNDVEQAYETSGPTLPPTKTRGEVEPTLRGGWHGLPAV